MKRLLAIASGGGHWDELVLFRDAFVGYQVVYATTLRGQAERDGIDASIVADSNRRKKLALLRTVLDVTWIMLRTRPHAVVSTGATPGLIAVALGRLLGAKTVWVDSIANAEELSLSGKVARRIVDLHLTQWEHLKDERTQYFGGTL